MPAERSGAVLIKEYFFPEAKASVLKVNNDQTLGYVTLTFTDGHHITLTESEWTTIRAYCRAGLPDNNMEYIRGYREGFRDGWSWNTRSDGVSNA